MDKREIDRRYYQRNRMKVLARVRDYYQRNKESISQYKKEWWQQKQSRLQLIKKRHKLLKRRKNES